jgi:putative transposase
MMRKKKHTNSEIAAKLAQANDMASQGKLQSEIARALGVSVMTLHRWRKAPVKPYAAPAPHGLTGFAEDEDQGRRISDLQVENSRLRRLVTDLLLEKMKLEEGSLGHKPPTRRASR